jgi:hypothetical protein
MTHPTDDELEAMAEMVEHCQLWPSDRERAAAMLRACKAGDAPSYLDGWNYALEAARAAAQKIVDEVLQKQCKEAAKLRKRMIQASMKPKLGGITAAQRWAIINVAIRALTPPERLDQ